ncbi:MAG: ComEC/Rec2 family competence protein [Bacteroidaceae bacterium]|nr:ComEC/Rec2 family competence protein [Bacteroidaceae bacterium]
MSRPVLLATLAMVAGIVAADYLFYDAWLPVPRWLGLVLWGISAVLALLAVWSDRRRRQHSVFRSSWGFAALMFLFFLVLGFQRYASSAQRTRAIWASMERPPVNRGNPDEYDYRRWRWIQGEADTTTWLAAWKHKALAQRSRLLEQYRRTGLQDQTLAIVAAMTLGDRSLLQTDTRELYIEAGASHLLALSGLHLGILTGVFMLLFTGPLLRSRWRAVLAVMMLFYIWAYVFLAGLPTSLVRAGTMDTIFILASLLHRQTPPINLLLLAAVLLLLVWPLYLFDVGAQLSFAAVGGIAVCFQPAYRWLFSHYEARMFQLERFHLLGVLELLGVSLFAQIFTTPLVLWHFHRLPVYGVLFSVLLIPLTTLLMYVAVAVLVVGSFWLWAGRCLAVLLTWLVTAQLWVMRVETSLPGACIGDFWSQKAEPQLVVYHNRRCPALHVIASPADSWLLMPQPEADSAMYYIRREFWSLRLTREPQLLQGSHVVSVTKGGGVEHFTAVMVNENVDHPEKPESPEKTGTTIDVLWITRGFRGSRLEHVATLYQPRLLVLDASLSRWQRQALHREALRLGWPVYDVAERGALRLPL